jgi:hypothetical protein
MTTTRVQYDAYNRHFRLLDGPGVDLQDGETYLVMDFSTSDIDSDSVITWEQEPAHS